MATLVRLSHVGFSVPRARFDEECEFWEKLIGLTYVHGQPGRVAFFTADPLRDHEFIIYAADGPIPGHDDQGCMVNHFALDVATDAEVDELTQRLRGAGYKVDEPPRNRKQNKIISPCGIMVEINTPPYMQSAPGKVGD